ncbi:hypothetical protein PNK_0879 [Candidatus Protochlamydia naegleriophila]|uniref:Uncharacterized protein n=1 Tax=Candidatus Protochlamydia naegleriophila TaxID=389348 RepID=A0A0U5J9N4_9BACT|nr:BamA/TamA family outer membrane protein [Candidatus Protochlamydia naegleriophila]CUI16504.1 hypothetical protein PNK_0879 [Candidatus Protochlamydia naegleriophila]
MFISAVIKNLGLHFSRVVFIFAVLFLTSFSTCCAYDVHFEGVEDKSTLKLVESVSQLVKLKNNPPATLVGLKRRAEGDIPNLTLALHSLAYYEAKVSFQVADHGSSVVIQIETGPIYPLSDFTIRYFQNGEETTPACPPSLEDLKVVLGQPAIPETILTAEDILLDKLNLQGYAFASIRKRDVFADQQQNVVIVSIEVDTGPLTYFGPIDIKGLDRLQKSLFYKKLRWHEGELYDPKKLEKTQEALELSGLFRSVNIRTDQQSLNGNLLPIEINVVEAKQRSIGFGLNYTTQLGPGITGEWEDRNIAGEGQKLSFRTDIWEKLQDTRVTYLIPDYKRQNQNLIWQLDSHREHTKAFTEKALSLSATIERKLSERLRISYGLMYKLLRSERSERNGTFDLAKVPLQLQWANVDSILDPTKGAMVHLRVIPSLQFIPPCFAYSINTLTTSFYQALTKDKRHVFAAKLMLGSIIGASKHDIPPPERFYAGSENALRGYRYLTVSPIGRDHKPLGGRSLLIYSLELRSRIGKNFGLVTFYEIGNVFRNYYPDFRKEFLQSAGVGIRYHTPVGPLRADFAVPLNRRHHIDNPFEVYFSIGQAF